MLAVLAERVEPAVAASAIAARELGVREIDAGVERRDGDSAAVDAMAPELGRARAAATPGSPVIASAGWMASCGVALDRAHLRARAAARQWRLGVGR